MDRSEEVLLGVRISVYIYMRAVCSEDMFTEMQCDAYGNALLEIRGVMRGAAAERMDVKGERERERETRGLLKVRWCVCVSKRGTMIRVYVYVLYDV